MDFQKNQEWNETPMMDSIIYDDSFYVKKND